jgi:hypothetical protein
VPGVVRALANGSTPNIDTAGYSTAVRAGGSHRISLARRQLASTPKS